MTRIRLEMKSSLMSEESSLVAESEAAMLKRRRQLHRDSMRRHRQRREGELGAMRAMLQRLTHQFAQLDQAQVPAPNSPRRARLLNDYMALAHTSQRLHADQQMLQHNVIEAQKLMLRMAQMLMDHQQECAPISMRLLVDPTPASTTFRAITELDIQHIIRRANASISGRELLARPLEVHVPGVNHTFGWNIACDLSNENDFFVTMTKTLSGVTAFEAMSRTWATLDSPVLYPHMQNVERNDEVVQVVNDRAFVEVMDVPLYGDYEGQSKCSCIMNFNAVTSRGFVVGLGTLPQEHRPVDSRDREFVDATSWTELEDAPNGSCLVRYVYRAQYSSGNPPYRRLINLLATARQWEDLVTQRPLALLP